MTRPATTRHASLLVPLVVVGLGAAVFARCSTASTTPDKPGPNKVVAHRITAASDLFGGTDALGGVGDWYLANDVVAVVIDDVANQNGTAPSGGTLIDFGHLGKNDDQFNSMYQIFAVSQDFPVFYDHIEASEEAGSATLTVTGHVFAANPAGVVPKADAEALMATTTYRLLAGDPSLHVRTEIVNKGTNAVSTSNGTPISDVILWGQRSAVPFAPYRGRGFTHPELDVRNPIAAFGAFLYVGARSEVDPPVSYGLVAPSLPQGLLAGVNDEQLSGLGLWPIGGPLVPGASMVYERRVLIGGERSIASVADQALRILKAEAPDAVPALGELKGAVTGLPAGKFAEVTAELPATLLGTKPTNTFTLKGDGAFHMMLPPATYQVTLRVGASAPVVVPDVVVKADETTSMPDIAAPPLATVTFAVTSDGAARPSRVTFRGVSPTVDPQLGPRFSGRVSGHVAYAVDGKGVLGVEPGTYDVYASRGLEYSLGHERVTLAAGDTKALAFDLAKVVETTGWVSGDFHVHSGASFDASVELDTRLLTYAGEGVEVAVSTDHDFIVDYAPSVAALGLTGQIATVIGTEATGFVPTPTLPRTIGHNNAWPLKLQRGLPRNGSPADERIEPGELYDRLRAVADGTPVVQLNHPRYGGVGTVGLGYLTNFGYLPGVAVPASDTSAKNGFLRRKSAKGTDNLAFDAIEVLNGASWEAVPTNQQNRTDWLALLRQGIVRTGMANSDSHTVLDAVGFPRTYVRYAPDAPGPLATSAAELEVFDAAIRAQHAFGTNGPVITVTAGEAGPGDTAKMAAAGDVAVKVKVQAAPWMPVQEVRVLVNGDLACRITRDGVENTGLASCPPGLSAEPTDPFGRTGVVRYDQTVTVHAAKDAFVVVEAGAPLPVAIDSDGDGVLDTWDTNGDGKADAADAALGGLPKPAPAAVPDAIVPGLLPWAFTNPLFIDVGADGWTAPGLPPL